MVGTPNTPNEIASLVLVRSLFLTSVFAGTVTLRPDEPEDGVHNIAIAAQRDCEPQRGQRVERMCRRHAKIDAVASGDPQHLAVREPAF